MFVLLQVYPLEATAEDGSDDNCCLDVIAVDASEAQLRQFLAVYEPRYRAAIAPFDAWDDMSKDWGEEHDRLDDELRDKYQVYGALDPGTRFEILEAQTSSRPVPVRAA
jgi:hypothetical protein